VSDENAGEVAVRALAAMDSQDFEAVRSLLADDVVMVTNGVAMNGFGEIEPMLAASYQAFPDLVHTVLRVLERDGVAALQMRVRATHAGPFVSPLGEFPATGQTVEWVSAAFVEVVDGRARLWEAYLDSLTIHGQVGFTS
jgi:steroid delta-isomerase-like uncharacterized protein